MTSFNPKPAYLYKVGDHSMLGEIKKVDPHYEPGFIHIQLKDGRWFRKTKGELF